MLQCHDLSLQSALTRTHLGFTSNNAGPSRAKAAQPARVTEQREVSNGTRAATEHRNGCVTGGFGRNSICPPPLPPLSRRSLVRRLYKARKAEQQGEDTVVTIVNKPANQKRKEGSGLERS